MPPAPAARPGARRIDELEGLRGLLALWVALSHLACLCGLDALRPALVRPGIWEWLLYAGPAVDVFIILSGFAIFKLLQGPPLGYRAFYTGRAFRLFPVYLTCLALTVALLALSHSVAVAAPWHATGYFQRWVAGLSTLQAHGPAQLGLQLPLLHGLTPPGWPPPAGIVDFLPPAWSATLEWQFYLVAPALLALSRGPRRGLCLGPLPRAAVVVGPGCGAARRGRRLGLSWFYRAETLALCPGHDLRPRPRVPGLCPVRQAAPVGAARPRTRRAADLVHPQSRRADLAADFRRDRLD